MGSIFEPLITSGKVDELADKPQIAGLKASLDVPAKEYLKAMRIRRLIQDEFSQAVRADRRAAGARAAGSGGARRPESGRAADSRRPPRRRRDSRESSRRATWRDCRRWCCRAASRTTCRWRCSWSGCRSRRTRCSPWAGSSSRGPTGTSAVRRSEATYRFGA